MVIKWTCFLSFYIFEPIMLQTLRSSRTLRWSEGKYMLFFENIILFLDFALIIKHWDEKCCERSGLFERPLIFLGQNLKFSQCFVKFWNIHYFDQRPGLEIRNMDKTSILKIAINFMGFYRQLLCLLCERIRANVRPFWTLSEECFREALGKAI